MTDPFQAILVEGQTVSCTINLEPTQNCILQLNGLQKPIHIPFIPWDLTTHPGSYVIAVCTDDASSFYNSVDIITSNYDEGPITEQHRWTLFDRLGLSPLYQAKTDFSSSAALASVTDLERELIAYLQRHPEKMRSMHPDAFEKLVAELMASFGFDVQWTARDKKTAADVIAFKTDAPSGLKQNYMIECKRFSEKNRVGVEVARALYGAKVDEQFSNALLVTTSFFESGVERFAAKRWDFHLRDYLGLVEWLNAYRPVQEGKLHMDGRRLKITK
jgi:HJR/Mrr/RecB family endonuclease